MRLLVLNNLKSGGMSHPVYDFLRSASEDGMEYVVRCAAGNSRLEGFLSDAEEFDAVVVSGGDGSISSVAYALRNRDVPLLAYPGGTANLLCANLDSPIDPPAFAEIVKKRDTLDFDVGEVDLEGGVKHGFMMMAGAGYDAQIMSDAAKLKPAMGESAYFAAALAKLNPRVSHFKLDLDGKTVEADGIAVLLINFARIPLDLSITPRNDPRDGLLEVAIIKASNSVQLIPALMAAMLDREGGFPTRGSSMEIHTAREVSVVSDPPLSVQFDGEVTEYKTPFKGRALRHACKMIVDAESPRIQAWAR